MPEKYYQNRFYPFQDEVLMAIQDMNLDFYLTGGTVLSRCYLHHRHSDDLDFFVNNHPDFKRQCNSIIHLLKKTPWNCEVTTASASFVRLMLEKAEIILKIDFVNDVSYRYGGFEKSPIYYRIDNWRNILSNKLCALSRMEVKDVADILFIAKTYDFEWEDVFKEAKEKDLWVEPLEICKTIDQFPVEFFRKVKWIISIRTDEMKSNLERLHDDIFYGKMNSLSHTSSSRAGTRN